jgi:p-hydroxybenzoate 3-monooxygenase
VRAGVIEQACVSLLELIGFAVRLHAEGLGHEGIYLQFNHERHRVDFRDLVNGAVTIYGQQEVVRDLIADRIERGWPVVFESEAISLEDLEEQPRVTFRNPDGGLHEVVADYLAACDGTHGVGARVIDNGTTYHQEYPYAWLGILANVQPATDELIYAFSDRGFALYSMRSPTVSRLYLQVSITEDLSRWSHDEIFSELSLRLASPDFEVATGEITEVGLTPMRSVVSEPMRMGRLFLAGDAAHVVPPTGAKGLNLALQDALDLGHGLISTIRHNDPEPLEYYSQNCLKRVWQIQRFSNMMTNLVHRSETATPFERRLQWANQQNVVSSRAEVTALAERYVGNPLNGRSLDLAEWFE